MAKQTKKVVKKILLYLPAGKATPAPPLGTAISGHAKPMEVAKKFNAATAHLEGKIIPTTIYCYGNWLFDFTIGEEPVPIQLKKLVGGKGSKTPNTVKLGPITKADVRKIAESKLKDMTAKDVDTAMKLVAGTAQSMGITIKD